MKIAIACDHGARDLKNAVMEHLKKKGYEVVNFGTDTLDSCDYPDFAGAAARAVACGECEKGIVMCTTGIGVSVSANKIHGIRCALLSDLWSARMTRPWKSWTPGSPPNFPRANATSAASTK